MRRSNLLLGFALMALIAADIAVLAFSAHRAHKLGQARLQFAAAVSHELRTPLAAICSAADNLASGIVHEMPKVRQYGEAILNQGKDLADMVEQTLAFTGNQLGKERYEFEVLDPGEAVKQANAAIAPAALAAGVAIEERLPAALPQVLGDSQAIQRALVNLLTNALRYGSAGQWIGVSAQCGKAREIEITVADRGQGIGSGDLKRIFEPFYRASAVHSGSRGAGLGLTIVEQIARAHGGRVTAVSVPGEGSRFTLHLPIL
jgi:signal transduction histidine kinase